MVGGKPIMSHSVIWTAGTANHPFFAANDFAMNERHKVNVDQYLRAEPHIYVLGDNANTPYSGMAQTALHDASFVARNLARSWHDKPTAPYKAKKPITIIPCGTYWASVEWGPLQIHGLAGWALRQGADWLGFHDYEPWWKALEQWATEFGAEESCPICRGK